MPPNLFAFVELLVNVISPVLFHLPTLENFSLLPFSKVYGILSLPMVTDPSFDRVKWKPSPHHLT